MRRADAERVTELYTDHGTNYPPLLEYLQSTPPVVHHRGGRRKDSTSVPGAPGIPRLDAGAAGPRPWPVAKAPRHGWASGGPARGAGCRRCTIPSHLLL